MSMSVRPVVPSERERYDALGGRSGGFFDQPGWLDLFGAKLVRCGIFNKGGEMIGGFHYVRERYGCFSVVRNPPFTASCGPFLALRASRLVTRFEETREALEAMADHVAGLRYSVVLLALGRGVVDGLPFLWRGFKVSPNFTFRIGVQQTEGQLSEGYASRVRNDIRKAEKDGLSVRIGREFGVVGDLQLAALARNGAKFDQGVMARIVDFFDRSTNGFTVCTVVDGSPVAAALIAYHGQEAYYLMGGYAAEKAHHGAGALAIHTAMLRCGELGLRNFDFEGSQLPAVERFFRGFGGQLEHDWRISKAWLPLEVALKLRRRNLF